MMSTLLLLITVGQVPIFTVENKCPPKFTVVNLTPKLAVPVVAAKPTFRQPKHHSGHDCPNCGRSQYRISGWLPDGDHIHRCSSCGTSWSH